MPTKVTNIFAEVEVESVTLFFEHSRDSDSVPATHFSIIGGPIDGNLESIDIILERSLRSVVLPGDILEAQKNYSITIIAHSLIGPSSGEPFYFMTGG